MELVDTVLIQSIRRSHVVLPKFSPEPTVRTELAELN